MRKYVIISLPLLLSIALVVTFTAKKKSYYKIPTSFREAKPIVYKLVRDIHNYTIYCDCFIHWSQNGKHGTPDLSTCGYQIRKQSMRAQRIEIEHIVPVSELARKMHCWKRGSAKACQKNAEYNLMKGDLYNLWPAIGEINGDRKNYPYGVVTKNYVSYGQCHMKISFTQRLVEPPAQAKGLVARTYLYMSKKYKIRLTNWQKTLYQTWNKNYPSSGWEVMRSNAIKAIYQQKRIKN